MRPLTTAEVHRLVDCFVDAILWMKEEGFDGVQLHAAHGGLLSQFLSPYTNRRDDAYGGSIKNRARFVTQIVSRAKEKIGDFPVLIKMNATDYVEGGIDAETFPALAKEIAASGVDAIEISGGMWDCLARSEEELGFRPVPAPESHTRIKSPEKQSYFLKYAQGLDLDVPVILAGGNRDVERLEQIVRQGKVDFVGLCRPLISEPSLPKRWLEGQGGSGTGCISCNSCIYDMIVHPGREEPGLVACVFKQDREKHKAAQKWLASWVEENRVA
jgi:2,4-dienoyl-CoA reductase-like NADH-dependent reductase (Old Yellow Enzyme family)